VGIHDQSLGKADVRVKKAFNQHVAEERGCENKLNSSQLGDHALNDVPRHVSQYHSSCGWRSLDLRIGKLSRLGHCIIENTGANAAHVETVAVLW
jgi:hypothetical protein